MKKFVSSILLVTFLFFIFGYQLYFKYLQYEIQREIKSEIEKSADESELTLIVVSSETENEIHWIKKNEEFRYKGSMYDVVKIATENGKKVFYCINDVKEKNLIVNYTRHNKRRRKALLRFGKILSDKYLPKNLSYNFGKRKANFHFAEYNRNYNSVYLEILPPPPEV